MKRIMALTAAVSLLALFVLTAQANAQSTPTLEADPPAVAGPGAQSITLTGTGWNPGLFVFVVECTVPGDQLTTATPMDEIVAAMMSMAEDDCTRSPVGTATAQADGTITVGVNANVTANYALGVGDIGGQQSSAVPIVFVAEAPPVEEPPEEEPPAEEEAPTEDDMAEEPADDMAEEPADDMAEEPADDMAEEPADDMAIDDGPPMDHPTDGGDDMVEEPADDMAEAEEEAPAEDDMAEADEEAAAVADMGDDMAAEGGPNGGFGGAAGSDSNRLGVPLAATLAAMVLLGGAALVARRNA